MKHLHALSHRPCKAAQDITIGEILAVIGQIVTVIATALVGKESGTS